MEKQLTIVSDLHGFYPQLKGGDLLIIAGDLTANDSVPAWCNFFEWLAKQQYKKKIIIAGNHDNFLTQCIPTEEARRLIGMDADNFEYLCDSGTEFEGLKIWGSPYTRRFTGQNKNCMAFSVQVEFQLRDHFDLIPNDTDILITHSPPLGILDECSNGRVGSEMLRQAISRVQPRLVCFGHIHEQGGKSIKTEATTFVNASIVNEYYQDVNKPVRIELMKYFKQPIEVKNDH